MEENAVINNYVSIVGELKSDITFSHTLYGEDFYSIDVEVPRLSKIVDRIPITVSERLIDLDTIKSGDAISLNGQFRSYNRYLNGKNRLILTVFAKEFEVVGKEEDNKVPNYIFLEGYICKNPLYRTTPFGREITDLLVAVNRAYNKSDYIPCICWGRNARCANEFNIGDQVRVYGRIQSRNYQKKIDDDQSIEKTAYEVSVTKVELESEK